MAQNSTLHQIHEEEIALGIALGPVSEKHRFVLYSNYYYCWLYSKHPLLQHHESKDSFIHIIIIIIIPNLFYYLDNTYKDS